MTANFSLLTTNSENTSSPQRLMNSRDRQLEGPVASLTTGLLQEEEGAEMEDEKKKIKKINK